MLWIMVSVNPFYITKNNNNNNNNNNKTRKSNRRREKFLGGKITCFGKLEI